MRPIVDINNQLLADPFVCVIRLKNLGCIARIRRIENHRIIRKFLEANNNSKLLFFRLRIVADNLFPCFANTQDAGTSVEVCAL